ncbi:MAG TPA: hypothetical protein ENN17_05400 [bacterium]|nr:hypothetical protein [bacterium]
MEIHLFCHACGKEITFRDRVYRQETCARCGRPVHCCKNCRFYDTGAHQQCREPQAEWVNDKEAANFCDEFFPAAGGASGARLEREAAARKKLDELFKKR